MQTSRSSTKPTRPDVVDILARLVAFDTTSHKSNLDIIDFIKTYLEGYGIFSELILNDAGDKANLFATIGPKHKPGFGLSAHTDVVPVTDQKWSTDPFQLTEKEGRLYGRGTCDMKGFLACVLAAVPYFVERNLQIPLHLLFSYDEEIGCVGVRPMIAKFGDELVKPHMVLVGEPSDMKVVTAHKGSSSYITEVIGREAHSSVLHLGVNAIVYASQLVLELRRLGSELRRNQHDPKFTPPFSSVHVGQIQGGTALNIVPRSCHFVWEIRNIPGHNPAEIYEKFEHFAHSEVLPEMKAVSQEAAIHTQPKNKVYDFQTATTQDGEALTSLVMNWTGQNATYSVSYGTEAGFFEKAGSPSIICGPGSIEQAHKPDEYVTKDQLEKCMHMLQKLADYAEGR